MQHVPYTSTKVYIDSMYSFLGLWGTCCMCCAAGNPTLWSKNEKAPLSQRGFLAIMFLTIGNDAHAIVARDLAVHLGTVCRFDAFTLDPLRGCADLALRLKPDALRLKAAMVDARVYVEFGQTLVDMFGPAFPPAFHHFRAVPVADLLAETILVHAAHGQHDMGMGFRHPALTDVPMHIQIGDHALVDKLISREVAGEFDALCLRHLAGNGELHLAGKLGILANLERLDIVPEPFTVAKMLRCSFRQHDLGMDDTAFIGEILHAADALVAQSRGRAVSGGGHRARPGLAANDLDVKMIDRHRDQALARPSARRNDV